MIDIQTAICPRCKKEFVPAPMHAYIHNGKRYCTYTCLLHRSDGRKRTDKHKTLMKTILFYKDGKLAREYPSAKEASNDCKLSVSTIRRLALSHKPTRYGETFKYKEKEQCEKD